VSPRCWIALLLLAFALAGAPTSSMAQDQAASPPSGGDAVLPLGQGRTSSDVWRGIKRGEEGFVTLPNPAAGTLIQSEGESWRTLRNGPYKAYAAYAILAMVAVLALFFALRGRMRVERGWAGVTVPRFNELDRFTHWLTAISFVVLALTGLSILFGRALLIPLVGKDAFAAYAQYAKYVHDYVSFAFMLGLVMMFVLWVKDNIPNRYDVQWVMKGGGLFGGHAPAKKFNAGQKILFWVVILGGLSLSLSGLMLLFPFRLSFFGHTFDALGWLGIGLPSDVSPTAEQQLAALWHGFVGAVMTAIIIGHIYIGTLGMEGSFSAMGSGRVDLNWAREHHPQWARELEERHVPAE
jgi:formate dehydrogenase subunit gamma